MHERRSRPESAAGEPTPLSAPQAGIFGQAHERRDWVQLPCSPRSDVAHAALNSAAAQPLVAHELVKEQACFSQAASDFLLFRRGGKEGRGHTKGGSAVGAGQGALPPTGPPWAAPGGAGRAPTGHPQKFLAELLGGRRQLGPLDGAWGRKIAPRCDGR